MIGGEKRYVVVTDSLNSQPNTSNNTSQKNSPAKARTYYT